MLDPIRALHEGILGAVMEACVRRPAEALTSVAGQAPGDTIYGIDRVGESVLIGGLERVAADEPLVLVAEGLPGERLILPRGAREDDCRWRILVDPIDGTRGLMYQKRSAWILTGVAPNRGPATRLRDIVLAVQTELPLVKQHLYDQLWAVRGGGTQGRRTDRFTGASQPLTLRPSTSATIAHGFASVVRFFPGAREVLGAVDDALMREVVGAPPAGQAATFEDQYASTGGQLYELMTGHDRFIADLRPLTAPRLAERGLPRPLCCHPYDLAAALVAEEAGVLLTDGAGNPLDAPFDTTSDVHWVGYANAALRAAVEPALRRALERHALLPRA